MVLFYFETLISNYLFIMKTLISQFLIKLLLFKHGISFSYEKTNVYRLRYCIKVEAIFS